jgi:hypothetical protein
VARTAHLVFLLLALPVLAATRLKTPDEEALKAFRLTSENVRKAAAVARRLAGEVAKDPSLATSTQYTGKRAQTLDAKAKALEKDPRIASALRAESITAREYVMVQVTALQAGLIAAVKARGVEMDPADLREAINPANVEFVERHRTEMDELRRSQEELRKASEAAQGEEK